MRASLLAPLLAALAGASGCAGSRIDVTADRSRFPISLSGLVRDQSGRSHNRHSLTKVGTFTASKTAIGVLYSSATFPSVYDISEEINRQVALACGEAVVNLTISISDACDVLNGVPILNALPSWPGCVPVTVHGDIVRRRDASCPTVGTLSDH